MSALRRAQATKPYPLQRMLFFPLLSYNLYPRYLPKRIDDQFMKSKDSLLLPLVALGYKTQHFICLCSCLLLSYIYIQTQNKNLQILTAWEAESLKNHILHLPCRRYSERATKHKNVPFALPLISCQHPSCFQIPKGICKDAIRRSSPKGEGKRCMSLLPVQSRIHMINILPCFFSLLSAKLFRYLFSKQNQAIAMF